MTQQGRGGRSGETFVVVQIIITQEELPPVLAAIHAADPECFYYITPIG